MFSHENKKNKNTTWGIHQYKRTKEDSIPSFKNEYTLFLFLFFEKKK